MARFQLQTKSFADFHHACEVVIDRIPEALCDSADEALGGHASGTVWVPDQHRDRAQEVLSEFAITVELVG